MKGSFSATKAQQAPAPGTRQALASPVNTAEPTAQFQAGGRSMARNARQPSVIAASSGVPT